MIRHPAGAARRLGLCVLAVATGVLTGCGGKSTSAATRGTPSSLTVAVPPIAHRPTSSVGTSDTASTASTATTSPAPPPPRPPRPRPPRLHVLGVALASGPTPLVPAVIWRGRTAVALARLPDGAALLSFEQGLVELHLHSGTSDAGSIGWRFGPAVDAREQARLVAAFNGGFRLSTGAGGFVSYGHVAVPLRDGRGSIVTYADGTTDVGSWNHEVPTAGRRVVSVRQNLSLLVDRGVAADDVECLMCWGATLGGVAAPARSALGITADGHLIWAGGENLTVAALADVLLRARVVRAVELDINPAWVAAYLYGHRGGHGPLVPVPVVPGQHGIAGQYLTPWSRDFFSLTER